MDKGGLLLFQKFGVVRFNVIRDLIYSCTPKNKIIVDLGAGLKCVSDTIKCKKRIKIDFNKATKPDIVYDLSKGIPIKSDSVDMCIAAEILEHLYPSHKFVDEIRRVLKKEGYAIVSVPNICSLKYRIAFLLGKIPSHAARADSMYGKGTWGGHIRDYNLSELISLFRDHNFVVTEKRTDGLSFKGRTIIPRYFVPKTLGDSVIIKTYVKK